MTPILAVILVTLVVVALVWWGEIRRYASRSERNGSSRRSRATGPRPVA